MNADKRRLKQHKLSNIRVHLRSSAAETFRSQRRPADSIVVPGFYQRLHELQFVQTDPKDLAADKRRLKQRTLSIICVHLRFIRG